MSRQLLVTQTNGKRFRITVSDEAKITFGPWSPPGEGKFNNYNEKALSGTVRVYENKKTGASVIGVFSGVASIREASLEYEEEVAQETVSTVWKSDAHGYKREEEYSHKTQWLPDGTTEAPQNEQEI